jgi:tRNA threonylcarbamoyladenosine biosynthesis protein TsaE
LTSPGRLQSASLRLPATVESASEAETAAAGRALAPYLVAGDVVALSGPLGAGKTCFTRGLVKGLGARDPVVSPTFTLVREHAGSTPVRHVDLYRLTPGEVAELDWRDLFYGPAVAVVEWAERAGSFLPERAYGVRIDFAPDGDPGHRTIAILPPPTTAAVVGPPIGKAEAGPPTESRIPAPETTAAPPSNVLAIDTSTRTRSLALLAGGVIRELFWGPADGGLAAEDMAENLRGLLDVAGLQPRELELVAVSLGPGSFTGVKVGLASAKALAYALGCPVKGVSTLDVLAAGVFAGPDGETAGAPRRGGPLAAIALIDARRGEVFGSAYLGGPEPLRLSASAGRCASDPHGLRLVGPVADVLRLLADALPEVAGETVPWLAVTGDGLTGPPSAGDGFAEEGVAELASRLAGRWRILRPRVLPWRQGLGRAYPQAADLALLARKRFLGGAGDDPFALQPLYLKAPEVGRPGEQGVGRDAG